MHDDRDPKRDGPAEVEGFPVQGWDRYAPVRLLGQGGVGRVFLARDLRLGREVALKFLHADSPERTSRLFAEARAQARVQHDRVCKVFEVGEVQGKPFIAMQYVEGLPLRALYDLVTLEQKVMLVRDAAEGVHAAHRAGLIHRDITPSNIMVQRTEQGQLQPYVMDFGLARDWQGEGTSTGSVLGTPQYMAPEQARGEVSRLDRRADVYALGATLYYLLTGRHPIDGGNALEIISRVGSVEPPAPRSLDPDLPAELEAIVLKCLEKDRSLRYDSARALADDLERFLNGAPVRARPLGRWASLHRRVRKHRVLVAVVATCAVLVLLAGAQAVHARREAAGREQLARRFTEQVDHLEARARYAGLAPLHDTREDRRALRESMAELEAEIRRAGAAGEGPGHYALGRAHLALGDLTRAHASLLTAWERGYREPRVAYVLALVLGRLYQQERLEAERQRPAALRESELRRAELRYRDPALNYLRLSEGRGAPFGAYVTALLAFYEGRFDEVLRQLDAAGAPPSWFYEVHQLRGDALLARAMQHWNRGAREAAHADFEAGRGAYVRAAAIGESVPELHDALAELEYAALLMELYGQGDLTPYLTRGLEAVQRARAASPDDVQSHVLEARFHHRLAESLVQKGSDASESLARAAVAARAALALAPERTELWLELARGHRLEASVRQQRGLDPREQLAAALQAFEKIPEKQRNYAFHTYRGLVFKTWADYEDEAGLDSLARRAEAIAAYRASIALDPSLMDAWANLGAAYVARARHPHVADPDAELRQAKVALDRALTLNPKHVAPYFQSGQRLRLEAERLRDRGEDPTGRLREALSAFERGLAINARLPQLHNGAGLAQLELARAEWDAGRSPTAALQRAQASFEQARTLAPTQGYAEHNLGELYSERAAYALARGEDPLPSADRAAAWYHRALALTPDSASTWAAAGRIEALAALHVLERGGNPSPRLARAERALREALQRNPHTALAWMGLGDVRGASARWQARRGPVPQGAFEAAAEAYRKALELEPRQLAWRLDAGRLCRAWARALAGAGRDPRPVLQQAMAYTEATLAARPALAEALLLHASLLSATADLARPQEQEALRARALVDLRQALARNRSLRHP